MHESYLLATARYIELNPVKAGLAARPEDYPWKSSARAHLQGEDDLLVKAAPLLQIAGNWRALLATNPPEGEYAMLRCHERTGRPLGNEHFISALEAMTDRVIGKQKPGPKKMRS